MKVVIQCAARKRSNAGRLRTRDGRSVVFVADPESAPRRGGHLYARPDDISDRGISWRAVLQEYNEAPGDNPLRLLSAWRLYKPPVYEKLTKYCGMDNFYILSAGWGLLRAEFLTPDYDITFSQARNVERFKRRRHGETYRDFSMLPPNTVEPVTFFGGKDYIGLFCRLSESVGGPRIVWYNSEIAPRVPKCEVKRFHTTTRTNWQYECVR